MGLQRNVPPPRFPRRQRPSTEATEEALPFYRSLGATWWSPRTPPRRLDRSRGLWNTRLKAGPDPHVLALLTVHMGKLRLTEGSGAPRGPRGGTEAGAPDVTSMPVSGCAQRSRRLEPCRDSSHRGTSAGPPPPPVGAVRVLWARRAPALPSQQAVRAHGRPGPERKRDQSWSLCRPEARLAWPPASHLTVHVSKGTVAALRPQGSGAQGAPLGQRPGLQPPWGPKVSPWSTLREGHVLNLTRCGPSQPGPSVSVAVRLSIRRGLGHPAKPQAHPFSVTAQGFSNPRTSRSPQLSRHRCSGPSLLATTSWGPLPLQGPLGGHRDMQSWATAR